MAVILPRCETAMAFILMGAGLLLFGAGAMAEAICQARLRRRFTCVESHSEDGLNYPWLAGIHGGLKFIEYEEPAGSGVWKRYTKKIWRIHCRVISHDPATLAEAHVRAFITPTTRFARLMFHFHDGTSQEPTAEFYQLEADWTRQFGK